MIRQIIKIDEELCNGCGACAEACHEGAIAMIDGKAKLIRDDYCDGLGNCLPVCPTGAISFEQREAAAFDEEAVKENMLKNQNKDLPCGCPGTNSKTIERKEAPCGGGCPGSQAKNLAQNSADTPSAYTAPQNRLSQWPVQIKLVPVNAPYFKNANLLVAADCSAYAYANFHERFMRNHITLIGCPKLDMVDYTEKLTAIIKNNDIKSVTAVRMQVPCCGGIEFAVKNALQASGKFIPWQIITLSTDGEILA
jgi:ferredoxin